ncbi:hypothetical protein MTO96_013542 [Rhipicephalus appendiculatus]
MTRDSVRPPLCSGPKPPAGGGNGGGGEMRSRCAKVNAAAFFSEARKEKKNGFPSFTSGTSSGLGERSASKQKPGRSGERSNSKAMSAHAGTYTYKQRKGKDEEAKEEEQCSVVDALAVA